ncbi:hypothetical protein [Tenacibaculum finnmarkense]|nr:hypothetical protein [Tenacibaculum finnmarkense]MCG8750503.1 hypothetical protein [Tenacibaculum finnmarkense]MCG8755528.1 hypothetical protein [Tenacibaculum finnmarkense]MCG8784105.1 hypothetical protein [Tenacibaculum finnmarkense]MCG8786410.1 hypothetical protein [Tenacibaculum finnmarkense]
MKEIKIIFTIVILQFSLFGYSQTIRKFQSDYSVKVTISENESLDGGKVDGIIKKDINITYDIDNQTVELKTVAENETILFLKNVKYNQKLIDKGKKYVAYTAADQNGKPFFITFSKDMIKIDNRMRFKSMGFHLISKDQK